jgi:hypothetical protein
LFYKAESKDFMMQFKRMDYLKVDSPGFGFGFDSSMAREPALLSRWKVHSNPRTSRFLSRELWVGWPSQRMGSKRHYWLYWHRFQNFVPECAVAAA